MDGTGTLGRRQRQPVRTRTAPPPRRYPPEKQDDYEDDDPRDRRQKRLFDHGLPAPRGN